MAKPFVRTCCTSENVMHWHSTDGLCLHPSHCNLWWITPSYIMKSSQENYCSWFWRLVRRWQFQKDRKCMHYNALSSLFCIPLHFEMDHSQIRHSKSYICHSFRINHFLLSWSPSFAFSFQLCLNFFSPHILVFQMLAFSLQLPFSLYPKFINLWNQVKDILYKKAASTFPYPSQTTPRVSSECQWNQK